VSHNSLPSTFSFAVRTLFLSHTASIYRVACRCTNHSNPAAWNTLSTCKARIIEFVWAPTTSNGVRLSSIKFVQRVVLLQTRGISDPRVRFLLEFQLAL
jgi:hypothetical protein